MNEENRPMTTFAALDRDKGIPDLSPLEGEEYPLPAWYRGVREIPLEELSIEDISKALRQQIHPEYVVPIALRILETDPLAGEMYDGELLASLKAVAPEYWLAHADATTALRAIVEKLLHEAVIADDIRRDASELRESARCGRSIDPQG